MSFINSLKFLRNISDYAIKNRNRYFVAENNLPDNTIVYKKNGYFFCPTSLVVYKLWENHCTARYIRHEVVDYLGLIKDRHVLVDIGASSGMFSCIFAAEKSNGSILSVEPDNIAYDFLVQTINLNRKAGINWINSKSVISDFDGEISFNDAGFGGNVGDGGNIKKCYKLETICKQNNIIPDVLKIDIESYEYELITSSLDYLRDLDVRIQIEIHNEMIIARRLDPWKIYEALERLGFRGVGTEGGIHRKQLLKDVCHLHLVR